MHHTPPFRLPARDSDDRAHVETGLVCDFVRMCSKANEIRCLGRVPTGATNFRETVNHVCRMATILHRIQHARGVLIIRPCVFLSTPRSTHADRTILISGDLDYRGLRYTCYIITHTSNPTHHYSLVCKVIWGQRRDDKHTAMVLQWYCNCTARIDRNHVF